jgi:hypothetical protein
MWRNSRRKQVLGEKREMSSNLITNFAHLSPIPSQHWRPQLNVRNVEKTTSASEWNNCRARLQIPHNGKARDGREGSWNGEDKTKAESPQVFPAIFAINARTDAITDLSWEWANEKRKRKSLSAFDLASIFSFDSGGGCSGMGNWVDEIQNECRVFIPFIVCLDLCVGCWF